MHRRSFATLMLTLATSAALAGCAPTPAPAPSSADCLGVRVIVNFDLLGASGAAAQVNACSPLADGTQTVADALAAVGVTTEGTAKYGDQVVCRVNGLPAVDKPVTVPGHSAYTETCANMAPEFAYWALWIKSGEKAWAYATEGVASQHVSVGDSIGLVFTTGGATPTPAG